MFKMWWEGWGGVCVILYHTAQSVFSPIHHLLSLVPYMFLLAHLTTVSLFLLAAYGLTGLSRGGQQVSKCKEVFGKAVKLLVDLASLQVCILHLGWLLSSLNGKADKFFFFWKGSTLHKFYVSTTILSMKWFLMQYKYYHWLIPIHARSLEPQRDIPW